MRCARGGEGGGADLCGGWEGLSHVPSSQLPALPPAHIPPLQFPPPRPCHSGTATPTFCGSPVAPSHPHTLLSRLPPATAPTTSAPTTSVITTSSPNVAPFGKSSSTPSFHQGVGGLQGGGGGGQWGSNLAPTSATTPSSMPVLAGSLQRRGEDDFWNIPWSELQPHLRQQLGTGSYGEVGGRNAGMEGAVAGTCMQTLSVSAQALRTKTHVHTHMLKCMRTHMQTCTCTYTCTRTHTCTYTHTCTHLHTHTHMCTHTCTHVHSSHTCTNAHTRTHTHTHTHTLTQLTCTHAHVPPRCGGASTIGLRLPSRW